MADPIAFDSATARFSLPLLFAGQAQKELTVNESAARLDAVLHACVEGTRSDPPAAPVEGECWLVAADGIDAWAGRDGCLASFAGGSWLFVEPRDGIRAYDRAARNTWFHVGGTWLSPARPALPLGGATADSDARTAIAAMYGILATLGLIPPE
ncbi:DUF2793 domain-containing protein [Parablastomonas sp. CN1-191]|uniref:DUF2793 domain-containing protein n=1 Tax=Parablastomonas sp. CN1-191 TaxID=3400908 RepID=UPI003BF7DD94